MAANNKFRVKRTNTAGRTPNTTGSYTTNSQYIAAGELALNMVDQILYTSDGTNLITVGSNTVNQKVTGILTVNAISANGSLGVTGQVLASNGSAVYWSTASGTGTVTSVDSGNGLTGGPITSSGSLSVLANTGIVANSTGLFVNSSYIGTLSANNASYLGGVAAASYITNTGNYTISGNLNFTGTNTYFTSTLYAGGQVVIGALGDLIMTNGSSIQANGTFGTSGQALTSDGSGNMYWSTIVGTNTAAQYTWTNTHVFTANVTVGNTTTNNTFLLSYFGTSNPNTFTAGTLTTTTGINTVLAGPYTIATGNTLTIALGSRVVIV